MFHNKSLNLTNLIDLPETQFPVCKIEITISTIEIISP